MKLFLSQEPEERARIEIIPMIDIMFFLLVVFIFISLSLIKLNAMSLNLPKASARPMTIKTQMVDIAIEKEGTIFFKGTSVNRAELRRDLEALPKGPDVKYEVIISGDRDTHMQRLVDVLDLVNNEGFSNLAIRTDKESDP